MSQVEHFVTSSPRRTPRAENRAECSVRVQVRHDFDDEGREGRRPKAARARRIRQISQTKTPRRRLLLATVRPILHDPSRVGRFGNPPTRRASATPPTPRERPRSLGSRRRLRRFASPPPPFVSLPFSPPPPPPLDPVRGGWVPPRYYVHEVEDVHEQRRDGYDPRGHDGRAGEPFFPHDDGERERDDEARRRLEPRREASLPSPQAGDAQEHQQRAEPPAEGEALGAPRDQEAGEAAEGDEEPPGQGEAEIMRGEHAGPRRPAAPLGVVPVRGVVREVGGGVSRDERGGSVKTRVGAEDDPRAPRAAGPGRARGALPARAPRGEIPRRGRWRPPPRTRGGPGRARRGGRSARSRDSTSRGACARRASMPRRPCRARARTCAGVCAADAASEKRPPSDAAKKATRAPMRTPRAFRRTRRRPMKSARIWCSRKGNRKANRNSDSVSNVGIETERRAISKGHPTAFKRTPCRLRYTTRETRALIRCRRSSKRKRASLVVTRRSSPPWRRSLPSSRPPPGG